MTTEPKPGLRSTEFWQAIAVLVCATALLLASRITESTWAIAAGLTSFGYSLSRGVAKGPPR